MKAKTSKKAAVAAPKASEITASFSHDPDELMDMEQAIAILRTTRATFYRWLRAGRLKGSKLGRQWRFRREDIERLFKGAEPRIDLPADITPLLETLRRRLQETCGSITIREDQGSELAQAVDLIIQLAAKMKASEIHIEPQPDLTAWLRFRLDGGLHTVTGIDLRLLPAIIQHWKTLAACNVREVTRPQDGRIRAEVLTGGQLELRVTFIPVMLGESLAATLLDASAARLEIKNLGYSQVVADKLQRWLAVPWGTIVFTGPAGCGKTSSLYASLIHITNSLPKPKVMTVEAEPEYLLPGTTQVPVHPESGLGFAEALRAVLKSGSDVIMVGEIRDAETLALSLQAALTGHRVLLSLHTSEAASALQRMVDVGTNPLVVTEAAKLIIGQRLIRSLCPKCSIPAKPSDTHWNLVQKLARLGRITLDSVPDGYRGPAGCNHCNQTGYRGRMVIGEAFEVTPRIASAVTRGAAAADLRAIAVSEGMVTMAAEGIRLASEGKTSLTEVLNSIGSVYSAEPPMTHSTS